MCYTEAMFTRRILVGGPRRTIEPEPQPQQFYAGALALGSIDYTVPSSNVVYVAKNGNDTNSGLSVGAPKATFTSAVSACGTSGWTIVVRAGTYNQKLTSGNLTKDITLQNYPNEEVWFEGVNTITAWTNNGDGTWYCTAPAVFEHGADFSGTGDETRWIDGLTAERPFWPEMVLINGVHQTHTAGTVTAGKFKVDYSTNRIYIGTDPSGKTVKVTNLDRFLATPNDLTIRGIGFRQYASAMVSSGAITGTTGSNVTIENCHFIDFPIHAVRSWGTTFTVSYCTFTDIGMTAIGGQNKVTVENCYLNRINIRNFKREPTSAGMKFSFTNESLVQHNYISNCYRTFGIWYDTSCYDSVILNNHIDTAYNGVFYEACRKALVVNNYITNVSSVPLYSFDSGETEFWLNYADRGDEFDALFKGDERQNTVPPNEDKPFPGAQDWVQKQGILCNNIFPNISNKSGTWRLLAYNSAEIEDSWHYFDRVAGNLWSTQTATSSTTNVSRLFCVEPSSGTTALYGSNAEFQAAAPAGKVGENLVIQGTAITAQSINSTQRDALCEPLPERIASLVGLQTGVKALGPVLSEPVPRVPSY